ncbi:dipeptidyl-peptidase-4 [Streptosporangium becharense]|uniref:Dipeptidyl-peptidase-4 n=1 Tax=Streptosporangium becharense TaxID=1816182 RepID=A0A7W9MI62_9ACTN|nr:prolyl oligopeptidase family serine peptidase [Streptosporangium becharense]MBB2913483.1 dipeptidyl-peptidase-4 [Streptosporangium becharense]MBB5821173.1 dipeptidyl-peptidase-4 [Streptosporangium becharense]
MSESFPRLHARTRRFSLGVPRGFTIAPGGDRVVFLRTKGGSDPVTCLWEYDVLSGTERLIADPRVLAADEENLPPEERARRERSREQAGGIVGYSTDAAVTTAAFALAGGLYVVELATRHVRRLKTAGPVIDPRMSPTGVHVGYVSGGAFHIQDLEDEVDHTLARPEGPGVAYGLAEFVAAEELDRMRGYWWSPAGDALLVERYDESGVCTWHVADPANPARPPAEQRYPAAGTPNAEVELFVLTLDGGRVPVPFDDEYLVNAVWDAHGLSIVTLTRDQRTMRLFDVAPATGASTLVREDTDPAWVDVVTGIPGHLSDGSLVWVATAEGGRRLFVGDRPVTPPGLQVREVLDVDGETVLFRAGGEPTEIALWAYRKGQIALVSPTESGVYNGHTAGGTLVVTGQTLDSEGSVARVLHNGKPCGHIASHAERPGLDLRVSLIRAGERDLSTAVILPSGHVPGSARLPVLMDPYGGPHAQRVLAASGAYLTSQWFADQGFAVVVADGRGTPGRGPEFERAILHDLATPVLEDQIDALHGAAAQFPDDLDLSRVGIRGWSFGGYLAALAVLRRPDVFHAAVAGAPVTDWRLYDTCYTERYLGHPDEGHYEASSLFADADKLERPLLLIHGLADDNVVAAHTLRLSSALLAAGRPHSVLPLSGVTHMTPQEVVAENLLLLQVEFLKKALS